MPKATNEDQSLFGKRFPRCRKATIPGASQPKPQALVEEYIKRSGEHWSGNE